MLNYTAVSRAAPALIAALLVGGCRVVVEPPKSAGSQPPAVPARFVQLSETTTGHDASRAHLPPVLARTVYVAFRSDQGGRLSMLNAVVSTTSGRLTQETLWFGTTGRLQVRDWTTCTTSSEVPPTPQTEHELMEDLLGPPPLASWTGRRVTVQHRGTTMTIFQRGPRWTDRSLTMRIPNGNVSVELTAVTSGSTAHSFQWRSGWGECSAPMGGRPGV